MKTLQPAPDDGDNQPFEFESDKIVSEQQADPPRENPWNTLTPPEREKICELAGVQLNNPQYSDVLSVCGLAAVEYAQQREMGADRLAVSVQKLDRVRERFFVSRNDDLAEVYAAVGAMTVGDYEKIRKGLANWLDVRTSALDAVRREANGDNGTAQGKAVLFEDPEPWPEPVDVAELLDEISAMFCRYAVLPPHGDTAIALWAVFSHAHDAACVSPLLVFNSPTKRCGKTQTIKPLRKIVPRPINAIDTTAPVLFRAIERWSPTVIMDESDASFRDNEQLRIVMNAGHERDGAQVPRCVGDNNEVRLFSVWAPKIVGLIGKLPDTLWDRSIIISMKRKLTSQKLARLRADRKEEFETLKRKCARWAADNSERLSQADPIMPVGLNDRAADNWRLLISIADLAGGDWPEKARAAAVALSGSGEVEGIGEMLLADIQTVFDEKGNARISSGDLVIELVEMESRPWAEWRQGKAISKAGVARLLKRYDISPVQFWDAGKQRGYTLDQFSDVFVRYLPGRNGRTVEPSPQAGSGPIQNGRDSGGLPDGNAPKPTSGTGSTGLPDETGECGLKDGKEAEETAEQRHERLNAELTRKMRENNARKAGKVQQ